MKIKRELPFLSVKEVNEIEDYERFYYSKVYLKQKAGSLIYYKNQVAELRKLAQASGYKHFNKFIEHRKKWLEMEQKIPLAYLNTIGVKLDVLQFTVELDKENYQKALKIPLYPKYFMERMAPIYISRAFPANTPEEEAIEMLKEYARRKDKSCLINYPSIKTIAVEPDGRVFTLYYEPGIKVTKEYVIPTVAGKDIGKIYLL